MNPSSRFVEARLWLVAAATPAESLSCFRPGIGFSRVVCSREPGVPEQKWWGKILHFVFDVIRIPYTQIGHQYDISQGRWYGPSIGDTFPGGCRLTAKTLAIRGFRLSIGRFPRPIAAGLLMTALFANRALGAPAPAPSPAATGAEDALQVRAPAGQGAPSESRFHLIDETPWPELSQVGERAKPEADLGDVATDRAVRPSSVHARRFWLAAGEIFLADLVPWVYNRYIAGEPFARVSPSSWASNLRHLPDIYRIFDQDRFVVNQVLHPGIHGSFYFNAARTNGYSFWESVPFVLGGSLLWETFAETEKVDINDVATTFLGGINWGEVSYRSSRMLLDNEATGASRVLRELGGFVLNPAGGLTRLFTGEAWKTGPNPEDRLPSHLVAVLDAGYRHRGNEDPGHPGQALVSGVLRYGDPFGGQGRKPFDVFRVSAEFAGPSSTLITRFQALGLVADGELSSQPESEHRIGVVLGYDYQNSLNRVYQDESVGLRLLSRFPLPGKVDLRTDVAFAAVPLAAVESDYPAEDEAQPSRWMSVGNTIGRAYDYAPGGSAGVTACIRRDEVDLVAVGYVLRLVHSINGISNDSRVQTASAEGRIPLTHDLSAGGGWTRDDRLTTYDTLPSVHHSATEWRLFVSWILR